MLRIPPKPTYTSSKVMKRRQLFEFTDLPWWPKAFRGLLTDFTESLLALKKPFSPKATVLTEVINKTQQTRFIDLCSGSGGPWLSLIQDLSKASGKDISVLLTDKYPNPETFDTSKTAPHLRYFPNAVDALAVPAELKGIRTLFNGFHHFSPEAAAEILEDAVRNNQPVAIFEMLHRSWPNFLYFLLTPINVLLLTPWVRPRTLSRFLLTYLIPVAPLVISWDSAVSILRCYTPEELLAMAHRTNSPHYVWGAGNYRHNGLPVTYLIGYPSDEPRTPS